MALGGYKYAYIRIHDMIETREDYRDKAVAANRKIHLGGEDKKYIERIIYIKEINGAVGIAALSLLVVVAIHTASNLFSTWEYWRWVPLGLLFVFVIVVTGTSRRHNAMAAETQDKLLDLDSPRSGTDLTKCQSSECDEWRQPRANCNRPGAADPRSRVLFFWCS
ncbi:MAG: hypothetical protein PVI86_12410 [Phycisphaerae bacterium]|jgi:hypothetical protein